jgi:hypothetical protein
MNLSLLAEPRTGNVLAFNRNRSPRRPHSETHMSQWARHIIICVDDAFPAGTVRRLEAARPQDCFAIVDAALDVGEGARYLRAPRIWADLESELLSSRGRDYEVISFYIAPTHAHVLIREAEGFCLETTVERWKAEAIGDLSDPRALDRQIWAPGYFDTVLTDPREIEQTRTAILIHRVHR